MNTLCEEPLYQTSLNRMEKENRLQNFVSKMECWITLRWAKHVGERLSYDESGPVEMGVISVLFL